MSLGVVLALVISVAVLSISSGTDYVSEFNVLEHGNESESSQDPSDSVDSQQREATEPVQPQEEIPMEEQPQPPPVPDPYGGDQQTEPEIHELEIIGQPHEIPETWFTEVADIAGLGHVYGGDPVDEHGTVKASPVEGIDGVGVYVVDHDNDGLEDVLTIAGSVPTLHENKGGVYVESDSLPEIEAEVKGALFLDYDNDGYEDLYLLSNEESVFLENQEGVFVEREVGLEVGYEEVWGAATADYTGDGCLDVFVIQSNDWRDTRAVGYNDRDVTIEEDNGNPNRLFRGDCEGFRETTEEAGIEGAAWSLATSFVDLTGDGWPDIHVANDFNNDVLYLNQGDGSFERRVMPEFTNRNGMSSEVADVTGNGLLDIFVTNIYPDEIAAVPAHRYGGRAEGNNLLINQGDGVFEDHADRYGVVNGGWGWAALLEDFSNTGDLDLVHGDANPGITLAPPRIWRSIDDDPERVDGFQAGLQSTQERSIAALDYNADGSLDIATDNIVGSFRLYENQKVENGSLQVQLMPDGHTVIGSEVEVSYGGEDETQRYDAGNDYKTQSSRILHFGLGDTDEVDEITVRWADGTVDTHTRIDADQRIRLTPEEEPETLMRLKPVN